MLAVPEEIKKIFWQDNISEETRRKWKLRFFDSDIQMIYPEETLFPSEELFPAEQEPSYIIENSQMQTESIKITEGLCESDDLKFGECNAAQFEVTVADVQQDLTGLEFMVTLEVDGYEMAMGIYTVDSFVRQADRRLKKITAYDRMRKFSTDVSAWYQVLTFPLTLKEFRYSLCEYIGVKQIDTDLPLDDMPVSKTIDPEQLSGLDVLQAICEINGCFGHIDKTGRLRYQFLGCAGLYPSETLFPDDDLFPGDLLDDENTEQILFYKQSDTSYEDYIVTPIDRLQIRQEEGDVGVLYGKGSNTYVIEGNFLAYGKSSEELEEIAAAAFENIAGRSYRPCKIVNPGLPWIEVGDGLVCYTSDDVIETYCLKRTMTGIQGMMDTFEASGSIEYEENFGIQSQIIQLEGKSAVIKKSIEQISVDMRNLKENMETQFKQTAEAIALEAKRAGEAEAALGVRADQIALSVKNLNDYTDAQIKLLSDSITMKVSKGDVSSQLSIESGGIDIKGDRFSWTATNSSLTADGTLTVNQGLFKGSIDVGNGQFTVDSSGKVIAKSIEVGTSSSRAVLYGSTVLATNFSCNSSFNVDCYANMADIGGNTISCGTLRANHIYGSIDDFSDRRLKQNIHSVDAETAIRIIKQLKPVSYSMKRYDQDGIGFIAQDVQKICLKQGIDLPLYGRRGKYLTIPYINYIPLLVAAVQGQQRELDQLKRLVGKEVRDV